MPSDSNRPKQNRYVAYFDMLGFKTATLKNSAEAWGALSDLRRCMDEVSGIPIKIKNENVILIDRIKIFILADSVLIFTAEDLEYDLVAILMLTSELFAKALYRCVPLRGAITHGEFFYNLDLSIFGGVPFVCAYELEKSVQWSGIVVDDTVAERHKEVSILKDVIIPWDVPLKNGTKERKQVVDWVRPHKENFKKKPPITVADYYRAFEKLFGPYSDLKSDVQAKYINTVDFINCLLTGSVVPV